MEEDGITEKSNYYVGMLWAAVAYSGWYVLAVGVALFLASPYLSEKYAAWKHKKDEATYAAKYHKNPDLFEERMREVEQARQRMQERYDASAKAALEVEEARRKAKEEELARLMGNDTSGGRRLGTAGEDAASKLKNDYNPLMGHSSRGYRPPKRSCCGKGGCG